MKYLIFIFMSLLASCSLDQLHLSPHASYHAALVRENMAASARRWAAEAYASLRSPLPVSLPYSERRLLENEHLQPVTFQVELLADQLVQIELIPSPNTRAELFVDVFLMEGNKTAPGRVTSMAADEQRLTVSAPQDGRYLVRIQPSHTAVGLVDIMITSPYRYSFPVDIQGNNAVQSFFGAGRDGGRRLHEGIDIFAPRGTPVIAAEEGRITRVGVTPRGGKQVWVRGDRRSFYYAHLDSIAVAKGDKVARGQVLGSVGNTGNAAKTSPHLHFGIYKRFQGAIDPLPLVGKAKTLTRYAPPEVKLSPRWMSIAAEKVNVRAGPALRYDTTDSLARGDLVRVDAISGDWLRITAGNGRPGYVARHLTDLPVESKLQLDNNYRVASRPQKDAPIIGEFDIGQQLPSLGRYGDFTLVKMPGGMYGWASSSRSITNITGVNKS